MYCVRFKSVFILLVALLGLSACTGTDIQGFAPSGSLNSKPTVFDYALEYGPREDTEISLPAFDYTRMNERYLRKWVNFNGRQKPGTVVIDTSGPYLYLVQPGKKAIRYGIAVGREGFAWHGDAVMKWKQEWPTWTPPREMIDRNAALAEFEDGMPAGINNPLGARALYLYKDGRDTLFRIHGTNKPFSIGKAASSGCFRMVNQDVIDLYARVKPGAEVYVRPTLPEIGGSGI